MTIKLSRFLEIVKEDSVGNNTVTLYRGDATNIQKFSYDATDANALFGPGLYLTNNPRVAKDYTIKGETIVFNGEHTNWPGDRKKVIQAWLMKRVGTDVIEDIKTKYANLVGNTLHDWVESKGGYDAVSFDEQRAYREKLTSQYQDQYTNEINYVLKTELEKAKKEHDYRVILDTHGHYSIVKNSNERTITTFTVPKGLIDNTLNAEAPLPDNILNVVVGLFEKEYGPTRKLDFRFDDSDMQLHTIRDWVSEFPKRKTRYAWKDQTIGGNGENPSLDIIINGTHAGLTYIHSNHKEFWEGMITFLRNEGYTGFNYQGGARTSGIPHRAFVFWDVDEINKYRTKKNRPSFRRVKESNDDNGVYFHVTPQKNVESIMASGLVPTIGGRSKAAGEPEKAVYLCPTMKDVKVVAHGWLRDYYDEDETFSVLRVTPSQEVDTSNDWEYKCFQRIPPEEIQLLHNDAMNMSIPLDEAVKQVDYTDDDESWYARALKDTSLSKRSRQNKETEYNGLNVYSDNIGLAWTFLVTDDEENPVAEVTFRTHNSHKHNINIVSVIRAYVTPEYRGKGIIPFIYDYLINNGWSIRMGSSHTPHGANLWNKLLSKGDYNVIELPNGYGKVITKTDLDVDKIFALNDKGLLFKFSPIEVTESLYYHVTPAKNVPSIMKNGLVPKIGTRSANFGEADKHVYLFPSKDEMETAMMNWLGDEFDEDEPLAVLAVEVDDNDDTVDRAVDGPTWEYLSVNPIDPKNISVLSLNETARPTDMGTFVGVRFSTETINNIVNWMKKNGIDKPVTSDLLHTTVTLDKERFFDWKPISFNPPLEINPSSYSFELFGPENDVLVLKFDCPELRERHMMSREEYDVKWDWGEYKSHLTLSYDGDNDIDNLELPTFPLIIDREYVQPFKNLAEDLASISKDHKMISEQYSY